MDQQAVIRERHERQVKRAHAVYNAAISYVDAYADLLDVVGASASSGARPAAGGEADPVKIALAEESDRQLRNLAVACSLYLRVDPAAQKAVDKRLGNGSNGSNGSGKSKRRKR